MDQYVKVKHMSYKFITIIIFLFVNLNEEFYGKTNKVL